MNAFAPSPWRNLSCYTTFWQGIYTNSVTLLNYDILSDVATIQRTVECYANAWYKKKTFMQSSEPSGITKKPKRLQIVECVNNTSILIKSECDTKLYYYYFFNNL